MEHGPHTIWIPLGSIGHFDMEAPKGVKALGCATPHRWGWICACGWLKYLHIPYETLEMVLMAPMTIGEVGFGIWLLVKGGKE